MIKQIEIKNLLPNPFRKIDIYPIVRQVVEELKKSMEETGVWVGIVARSGKREGKYEIAFGHHRLAAMKELKIEKAPVDVQEIDDLRMVQQMAFENMSARKTNTSVILETTKAAREQLTKALDGWEWDHRRDAGDGLRRLFGDKKGFEIWKGQRDGVGRDILTRFLGPHWATNIKQALALITKEDAGKLDLKAAEKFDSPSQANAFAELVEEEAIPVSAQEEYAEKVIERIQRVYGEEGEEIDPADQSELTVSRIKSFGRPDEDIDWNNIRPKDRERWEINEALAKYTDYLGYINVGIGDIMENWAMISDKNKTDFALAAKQFFETLQEEKAKWKTVLTA